MHDIRRLAIPKADADFQSAYARTAGTIPHFIEHIQCSGDAIYSTTLRFREPDESERLGEDRFAFLWLSGVRYHAAEGVFSGTFFEVPAAFQKWHQFDTSTVSLTVCRANTRTLPCLRPAN